ncbi:hypothetical protein AB0O16_07415 [Microbacterium sp. NPDC089180]|uniref:hypothetical protein n=1 Tax=unclassified Microbacterium TaxID=2609290 RepID=UPI0034352C07
MEIFLSMQYSILSAADHIRAFNALLRAPRLLTTSTVTVARGAVEAFARAWHLATAGDLDDAQGRHLSALYSELRYPLTLGEQIYLRDGRPTDAEESRAQYKDELERLGLGAPARFETSRITAEFLSAAFQDDCGRLTYSTLSSVAHGHRLGVNSFIFTDDSGGVAGLTNTRQIVLDLVSTLT